MGLFFLAMRLIAAGVSGPKLQSTTYGRPASPVKFTPGQGTRGRGANPWIFRKSLQVSGLGFRPPHAPQAFQDTPRACQDQAKMTRTLNPKPETLNLLGPKTMTVLSLHAEFLFYQAIIQMCARTGAASPAEVEVQAELLVKVSRVQDRVLSCEDTSPAVVFTKSCFVKRGPGTLQRLSHLPSPRTPLCHLGSAPTLPNL